MSVIRNNIILKLMENNANNNGSNMTEGKKATMWIIIGVVLVLIIAALAMGKKDKNYDENYSENNMPQTNGMMPGESVSTGSDDGIDETIAGDVATAPQPAKLSYTQAVKLYKDRRIQFDNQCQVNPDAIVTYKNGTDIMIDNRSKTPRTIKIGPKSYTLSGYGFKIITVSSSKLPDRLLVDCGISQNVATIIVQK